MKKRQSMGGSTTNWSHTTFFVMADALVPGNVTSRNLYLEPNIDLYSYGWRTCAGGCHLQELVPGTKHWLTSLWLMHTCAGECHLQELVPATKYWLISVWLTNFCRGISSRGTYLEQKVDLYCLWLTHLCRGMFPPGICTWNQMFNCIAKSVICKFIITARMFNAQFS